MLSVVKRNKNNVFVFFVIVIFILMTNYCYDYIGLQPYKQWMKFFSIFLFVYMSFVSFRRIKGCWNLFSTEIIIICSTCITAIFSMLYEGFTTFPVYIPYLSFIVIFYLYNKKISVTEVESVLLCMAIIYLFCWLYQLLQVPKIVMGLDPQDLSGNEFRGFYRFYIQTKEHFSFVVFYFLALYNRKGNILFLFLVFLALIIVFLHVARQMIFWTILLALIYYLMSNKNKIKLLFAIALSVLFFYFIIDKMEVASILFEQTIESDSSINSADTNNIRFEAMRHFIEKYNNNVFSFLFGSGLPGNNTFFSHQLTDSMLKSYYLSDVGYVALYVNFGIISVILYMLLLFGLFFKVKVPDKYLYLKFYVAYLAFSHLGSHALTSNLIFFALAIYIIKTASVYDTQNNTLPMAFRK